MTESPSSFAIYGAYGFTGRLLAREAVERGHRPLLVGRRPGPLEALARELGLEWRVAFLDRPRELRSALEGASLVIHAAGPFIRTSAPMVAVCLDAGIHYLDITGEVPVFEAIFDLDDRARSAGVVLMPGVGFDAVPTDCLAGLVRRELPAAERLEIAVFSPGPASPGTLETVVEHLPGGLLVRRDGRLVPSRLDDPALLREVDFGPGSPGGVRPVIPYTWGDLATAWRSTGIPNITCYMASSPRAARLLPRILPLARRLVALGPLKSLARAWVRGTAEGPSPERRQAGRTRLLARASDPSGGRVTGILETMEAYRLTAMAGIRVAEEVMGSGRPGPDHAPTAPRLAGALTPAQAFGPEWVLDLPETRLVESPTPVSSTETTP